jgi:hypothetical protein
VAFDLGEITELKTRPLRNGRFSRVFVGKMNGVQVTGVLVRREDEFKNQWGRLAIIRRYGNRRTAQQVTFYKSPKKDGAIIM